MGRAQKLAERLEQGAANLAKFAETLSDAEWRMKIPHDGRPVGVIVHHVGNMYPIEIQLAQTLGAGKPVLDQPLDLLGIHGHGAGAFRGERCRVAGSYAKRPARRHRRLKFR